MMLYGIPNCDTVKKAKKWFDEHNVAYEFHDYKKHGAKEHTLEKACATFGWETVLNRRGTTWRKLDNATKDAIVDAPTAISLMMQQPSMIKRPIVDNNKTMLVGFNEEEWEKLL